MKMNRGKNFRRSIGFLFTLLLVLEFASCGLFSNLPDIDAEKAIDDLVKEANAPVILVAVDEEGLGTASPRGILSGVKQDVPFELNFNPFNDFGFLGWQALLNDTAIAFWSKDPKTGAVNQTGTEKVVFSPVNDSGTQATVRVLLNPGGDTLLIKPLGSDRPRVMAAYPAGNVGVGNPYIQFVFSQPLDYDSVIDFSTDWNNDSEHCFQHPHWGGDSGPLSYETEFKNITIRNIAKDQAVEGYFAPPYLSPDGLRLTLWANLTNNGDRSAGEDIRVLIDSDGKSVFGGDIAVTLGRNIANVDGVAMGAAYSFAFRPAPKPPYNDEPVMEDEKPQIMYDYIAIKTSDYVGADTSTTKFFAGQARTGEELASPLVITNPQSDKNSIYIVFQTTRITNAPLVGIRLYERRSSGSLVYPDDLYHYLGDFFLLRDKNPTLARELEVRAFTLMKEVAPDLDASIPIHAAAVTLPSHSGLSSGGTSSLYFYPLTGYDTIPESNDDDWQKTVSSLPNDNNGDDRECWTSLRIRYWP